MNIIWKKPDNSVAVTHLVEASDPQAHAAELQQRGLIPSDWVAVAFNAQLPPRDQRDAWNASEIAGI